ncbi:methylmalonyl-CoA mutase family protein [Paraliomyxa miuraensis]|uniref:methylmalonyl-CoA mutase family protein n=1 Tax=Paraliomyxa miuraensis TaxID=376150 RepID=UPI00225286FE|nr:methylmalonyl-CoA mutase family protein [Paraliomyxa miuraensis]MCX4244868.1 methylmalonyl-CoA mutase family protein [Paraliomyxa miuraensis]
MPNHDDPALISEFSAISREAWRARVEQARGRTVDELDAPSVEGFELRIPALRSADDGEPGPRPPARAPGWRIALEYAAPHGPALAEVVRHDVGRGLEVAWVGLHDELRAQHAIHGPASGVVLQPEQLAGLVDALGPTVALHLDAGLAAPAMARALLAARGDDGPADAVLFDPLTTLACTGGLGTTLGDAYAALAELTREVARRRPGPGALRTIFVDAVALHDAGASAEQEVAYAIAGGIEHLRQLEAHGLAPADALPHLAVRMAVGTDLLVEVAKLRAARRLWARVRAHAGLDAGSPTPPPTPLWVRSSWRSGTRRDPWVNLLRGSVAGFSAVVGGASVIAVQPATEALGEPDANARRWAINTQHILRGESHLGVVDDPAAGSWTFEALTDALARGAWERVQEWLADGGLASAIEQGMLQARIAERAAVRSSELATGRLAFVGTNLYPQLDEPVPPVTSTPVPTSGVDATPSIAVPPLARHRLTEPLEALRDRNDAIARRGRRPRAGLITAGDAHKARPQLDFARNFVTVGGFEPIVLEDDAEPPPDIGLAIVCAPPDALEAHGPAVALRLREAGVRRVLVAGRPTPALRNAGVHDFVHRGRDVIALLGSLQLELLPTVMEGLA